MCKYVISVFECNYFDFGIIYAANQQKVKHTMNVTYYIQELYYGIKYNLHAMYSDWSLSIL